MITTTSIIMMAISTGLICLIPLVGWLLLKRKHQIQFIPVLFGALFFILFALILEPVLHRIVLQPAADGTIALIKQAPLLYVLYGILAAGIFEETARLVAFTLLKKKYPSSDTGIAYGIGHGGIEALLLGALSGISNITLSSALNDGQASIIQQVPKATWKLLVDTPSWHFLFPFIERLPAFVIQICLSIIVWQAVKQKKYWLYPLAIGIHALIDLPSALAQVGWLHNHGILYGLLYAMMLVLAYITWQNFVSKKAD